MQETAYLQSRGFSDGCCMNGKCSSIPARKGLQTLPWLIWQDFQLVCRWYRRTLYHLTAYLHRLQQHRKKQQEPSVNALYGLKLASHPVLTSIPNYIEVGLEIRIGYDVGCSLISSTLSHILCCGTCVHACSPAPSGRGEGRRWLWLTCINRMNTFVVARKRAQPSRLAAVEEGWEKEGRG